MDAEGGALFLVRPPGMEPLTKEAVGTWPE